MSRIRSLPSATPPPCFDRPRGCRFERGAAPCRSPLLRDRLEDLSEGDLSHSRRPPMSRTRLPILLHLPPADLFRRYRACRRGVEKSHWQLLRLLTRPERPLAPAPAQAAAEVGLSAVWARAILKRWNAAGPDGLDDRRVGTCGGRSTLTSDQHIDLRAALRQPPPDGGLWSGPKVARYVRDRRGVAAASRPAGDGCGASDSRSRCRGRGTPGRPPRPSGRPGDVVTRGGSPSRWRTGLDETGLTGRPSRNGARTGRRRGA